MTGPDVAAPSAPEGPPRPVRFIPSYHDVRAMQFDGSRESAAAIAAKWPGRVAWSVEREGVLLAHARRPYSFDTLNELPPGYWLVEVERWYASDFFIIVRDDHFRQAYKASSYQDNA